MIYLASPYSHPSADVRAERFRQVCQAAACLIKQGLRVFSPIAHGHSIELAHGEEIDGWIEHNLWFLDRCESVRVLALPGWEESYGVRAELARVNEIGKPASLWKLVYMHGGRQMRLLKTLTTQ